MVERGRARDLERPAGAPAVRARPSAEVNMDGGAGHSPRPGSDPSGARGLAEENRELEKESIETAKGSPAQSKVRRGRRDHVGGCSFKQGDQAPFAVTSEQGPEWKSGTCSDQEGDGLLCPQQGFVTPAGEDRATSTECHLSAEETQVPTYSSFILPTFIKQTPGSEMSPGEKRSLYVGVRASRRDCRSVTGPHPSIRCPPPEVSSWDQTGGFLPDFA